jgi:hypothetical protein
VRVIHKSTQGDIERLQMQRLKRIVSAMDRRSAPGSRTMRPQAPKLPSNFGAARPARFTT